MSELITVTRPGEPRLKIHPDALSEHLKLGWTVVPVRRSVLKFQEVMLHGPE